ncbi:MAG: hypothetical protein WBE18_07680, partial [Gammaproteobacteria bacterium]
ILISGVSSGLVGIEMAKISISALILHFSIPLTGIAITLPVFGIAVIGALAYILLIYKSISDIIRNDAIRSWTNLFQRKENVGNFKHALKIIGMLFLTGLVIGLGVFATIATAGTWWYAAKAGAALIPYISQAAKWIRNIAIPIMGLTSLVFTVDNSLESLNELTIIPKGFHAAFKRIIALIKLHWTKENLFQFFNPFRITCIIISSVFKFSFFILHLLSVGLMGDKLTGVPEKLTVTLNALSEGLTDGHYIITDNSNEKHKHADLPEKLLDIMLWIPRCFSTLWDFSFSKFNNPDNQLTLPEAWKKTWRGLQIVDNSNPPIVSSPNDEQTTGPSYTKLAVYLSLLAARKEINLKYQNLPQEQHPILFNIWKEKTNAILDRRLPKEQISNNPATFFKIADELVTSISQQMREGKPTTKGGLSANVIGQSSDTPST